MKPTYDAFLGKLLMHSHPDGGGSYTNLTPMPQAVGGWAAGSAFNAMPIEQVLNGLFYPYQYPAFPSFAISGQATTLECGETIAAGAKTFTWTTSNGTNVQLNSLSIQDVTRAILLAESLANDGNQSIEITSLTKVAGNTSNLSYANTFRVSGVNSQGGSFVRDYSITWYLPLYVGLLSAGVFDGGEAGAMAVQQLTKSVSARANKTVSITADSQKVYFAYPAGWGNLVDIVDVSDSLMSLFTKVVVSFPPNSPYFKNTAAIDYNVYESNAAWVVSNYNITFKFS